MGVLQETALLDLDLLNQQSQELLAMPNIYERLDTCICQKIYSNLLKGQ
jgi:hypothetical protein